MKNSFEVHEQRSEVPTRPVPMSPWLWGDSGQRRPVPVGMVLGARQPGKPFPCPAQAADGSTASGSGRPRTGSKVLHFRRPRRCPLTPTQPLSPNTGGAAPFPLPEPITCLSRLLSASAAMPGSSRGAHARPRSSIREEIRGFGPHLPPPTCCPFPPPPLHPQHVRRGPAKTHGRRWQPLGHGGGRPQTSASPLPAGFHSHLLLPAAAGRMRRKEKDFHIPPQRPPSQGHAVMGGFGHPGADNGDGERPRSPWQQRPATMTFLQINTPRN